ncbi:MAG: cysteine methyltransferase [Haloplasmataceae bacterium]|jgi:methylated-DNA-[protein]-cysteine S-methyltransferase|nr:cysteine methyltransferase [Haloplasmataceae bacterium]
MEAKFTSYYESPIGMIEIIGNDEGIVYVEFTDQVGISNENAIVLECAKQLDEYFLGKRKQFDVNIIYDGSPFQIKVWKELSKIPFGTSVSYKDIATRIDNVKAVRAVGGANHKNKISIILPCHRVIGINGKLVGYGGGLWRKEWLIKHEKENLNEL